MRKSQKQLSWEKYWCEFTTTFLGQPHIRSHGVLSLITPPTDIPKPHSLTTHAIASIWKNYLQPHLNPHFNAIDKETLAVAEYAKELGLERSFAYDWVEKSSSKLAKRTKKLLKAGYSYDFDKFIDLVLAAPIHLRSFLCGSWVLMGCLFAKDDRKEWMWWELGELSSFGRTRDRVQISAWLDLSAEDVVIVDQSECRAQIIKRMTMQTLVQAMLMGENIFTPNAVQELDVVVQLQGMEQVIPTKEQTTNWKVYISGAIAVHRQQRKALLRDLTSKSPKSIPTWTGRKWLPTNTPVYEIYAIAYRQIASFLYRHPQLIPDSFPNIPSIQQTLKQLTKGLSDDPGSPPWYRVDSPSKRHCICLQRHDGSYDRSKWHHGKEPRESPCCSWCDPFDNVQSEYQQLKNRELRGKLTSGENFLASHEAFWRYEGDGRGLKRREAFEKYRRREAKRGREGKEQRSRDVRDGGSKEAVQP